MFTRMSWSRLDRDIGKWYFFSSTKRTGWTSLIYAFISHCDCNNTPGSHFILRVLYVKCTPGSVRKGQESAMLIYWRYQRRARWGRSIAQPRLVSWESSISHLFRGFHEDLSSQPLLPPPDSRLCLCLSHSCFSSPGQGLACFCHFASWSLLSHTFSLLYLFWGNLSFSKPSLAELLGQQTATTCQLQFLVSGSTFSYILSGLQCWGYRG